jgi:hypothetical protein
MVLLEVLLIEGGADLWMRFLEPLFLASGLSKGRV